MLSHVPLFPLLISLWSVLLGLLYSSSDSRFQLPTPDMCFFISPDSISFVNQFPNPAMLPLPCNRYLLNLEPPISHIDKYCHHCTRYWSHRTWSTTFGLYLRRYIFALEQIKEYSPNSNWTLKNTSLTLNTSSFLFVIYSGILPSPPWILQVPHVSFFTDGKYWFKTSSASSGYTYN